MSSKKSPSIGESIMNSWKALLSAAKTLYKLMPLLIISFVGVTIYLSTILALNTALMVCVLSFVIIISSICIYTKSGNYGEAVLSLSAGLLTVYTVNWTLPLFLGFIAVWLLFTVIVFLISSVRISSQLETIYLESSFSINIPGKNDKEVRKLLEGISNGLENSILMPHERAEIIRLFCFQKLNTDDMPVALKWVNIYYGITKIPYLDLASFAISVVKNSNFALDYTPIDNVFEYIHSKMRETPISPKEFIDAFSKTKYLLATSKSTILYFETLKDFFLLNLPYDELPKFLENTLSDKS